MAGICGVLDEMATIAASLGPGDPRSFFLGTYRRTTEAVAAEIAAGGFVDGEWTERWDVAFAGLYLDAFGHWQRHEPTPRPWQVAFDATRGPRLPPLRHVLLGINAHVNYDLPLALLAVITDDEFDDPAVRARRAKDHERIDAVLAGRVAAEDAELAKVELPGDRDRLDRLLQPLNRLATRRFLREARRKVWANARVLSRARRLGASHLDAERARLDALCGRRVTALTVPGRVLLDLAVHGFGVSLGEPGS